MQYLRPIALLLLATFSLAHASDPLPEPDHGRSQTVTQPHVTAELITETGLVSGNGALDVILHLHMDPNWHTYWINPGDAGLATSIKWTLPPGWTAGPIQWPTPEDHAMGPLTTYGYGGDAYLLTTLKTAAPPAPGPAKVTIHAHATWLVCQEECIPGKADLDLTVVSARLGVKVKTYSNSELFASARARLPVTNTRWNVQAAYQHVGLADALVLRLKEKQPSGAKAVGRLRFLAEQSNVIAPKNQVNPGVSVEDGKIAVVESLVQNGEKPGLLSGVLISDAVLIGEAKSVYLSSFPTDATGIDLSSASLTPAQPAATNAPPPSTITPVTGTTPAPPAASPPVASPSPAPTLLAILGLAFLGGLILNLMPCVLPVLSLKVFSLVKHAGEEGGAWKQGVAFAVGALVSFWILAGLLIALESAGHHLGWGFQMQSPGFVLALTFLFFLLALNLFGVFEFGTSLVGVDAKATSHLGGLTSSFANGALATVAATPCTAPFMGSAVGFAAQQPAAISLIIFTALALGMASPYLALTLFPGALRLVPKPGPWMEALKQFMGFLLMGTVIFLVYVFAAQTGQDSVPFLLGVLLLTAVAAWIFGRASGPQREPATRIGWTLVALALMAAAIGEGIKLAHARPPSAAEIAQNGWQPWSPDAVRQAMAQGHPVFVDFTAAWCLSCKVNEQVALDLDSTKKLFAQKHVTLLRGDWTNSDPRISDTLRQYNRDGVPLYLVYSPQNPNAPQVLPETLTPGIVRDALQKLP
jgi:thiol:disulfide interchange protein/DsbC/DsbD-like thiol-disulfide interchange protein